MDDIERAVRAWYAELAATISDRAALEAMLTDGEFVFDVPDGSMFAEREEEERRGQGRDEEQDPVAWLLRLRSEADDVRFDVSRFHVDGADGDEPQAHFQVDRTFEDAEGLTHVMRREQTWHLRIQPSGDWRVSAVEDVPTLAFTGTGPQIICY